MRFLHTADWHLGKNLNERSLLEDQEAILKNMLQWIEDNPIDALFICGDIYDRSLPPKEAVKLLDMFLRRCVLDLKVPVFIIAGNHDSPERIAYASSLLEESGLYVRGFAELPLEPVILGNAHIYMWPYTELNVLRWRHNIEADSMQEALTEIFQGVDVDPKAVNILLAHEYVLGGLESESERPLMMGKASALSSDVFSPFDLVLLGHLHRPQSVKKEEVIYSGSLLKYSKSEAASIKSANLIEIDQEHRSITPVSFAPLRDLRVIRGLFTKLLQEASDDFVYLELEDKHLIPDAMSRLRSCFPNALGLEYVSLERRLTSPQVGRGTGRMDLTTAFSRFYESVRGEPIPEEHLKVTKSLAEELERA